MNLIHRIPLGHWLAPSWWRYLLFGQVRCGRFVYPRRRIPARGLSHLICRARGHPHGVAWFNCGGLEPDMHCTNCGDDLG